MRTASISNRPQETNALRAFVGDGDEEEHSAPGATVFSRARERAMQSGGGSPRSSDYKQRLREHAHASNPSERNEPEIKIVRAVYVCWLVARSGGRQLGGCGKPAGAFGRYRLMMAAAAASLSIEHTRGCERRTTNSGPTSTQRQPGGT